MECVYVINYASKDSLSSDTTTAWARVKNVSCFGVYSSLFKAQQAIFNSFDPGEHIENTLCFGHKETYYTNYAMYVIEKHIVH